MHDESEHDEKFETPVNDDDGFTVYSGKRYFQGQGEPNRSATLLGIGALGVVALIVSVDGVSSGLQFFGLIWLAVALGCFTKATIRIVQNDADTSTDDSRSDDSPE